MMQRLGIRSLPVLLSLMISLMHSLPPPLWQDSIQAVSVLSVLREFPSKLDGIPCHKVLALPINYAGQVHYSVPSEEAK